MDALLAWFAALLRPENLRAALASLRRRLLRRELLEMRRSLTDPAPPQDAASSPVTGYNPDMRDACLRLLNAVGSLGFWTAARFEREILASVAEPGDVLVLLADGDVAGMCVLHRPLPEGGAEIGYVAVHPRRRGRGCGRLLLGRALALARSRAIPWVFLRTDAFRGPAIRAYLGAGFRPLPRDPREEAVWSRVLRSAGASAADIGCERTSRVPR